MAHRIVCTQAALTHHDGTRELRLSVNAQVWHVHATASSIQTLYYVLRPFSGPLSGPCRQRHLHACMQHARENVSSYLACSRLRINGDVSSVTPWPVRGDAAGRGCSHASALNMRTPWPSLEPCPRLTRLQPISTYTASTPLQPQSPLSPIRSQVVATVPRSVLQNL